VEDAGAEAKLSELKELLQKEGFFDRPDQRLLRDVDERQFRAICQNALEGLASKKLNLEMLIERRACAQERRVVPETIARFLREAAEFVPLALKTIPSLPHTFEPARIDFYRARIVDGLGQVIHERLFAVEISSEDGDPRAEASVQAGPRLQEPISDPARLDWNEVTKVAHYYLAVNAMTKPMQVKEDSPPYGGENA